MSGTSGSLSVGGGGVMLPAPKVQVYHPAANTPVFVGLGFPSSAATQEVVPTRLVKVTVPGIPSAILADVASYKPQIELLRYVRLHSRENASAGNGTKTGGYVHPSHGPAASGDGSFTHGGAHGGVSAEVQAIRPTEWPILSGADAVDVTQGMMGFMCFGPVNFRDNTGNIQALDLVYPAERVRTQRLGRRFPYAGAFAPGYFAFRLSIIDLEDARGKRIHGPVSQIVSATNHKFPFVPAGLDASGRAQADVAAGFDPKFVNFWIGSTSRLPTA